MRLAVSSLASRPEPIAIGTDTRCQPTRHIDPYGRLCSGTG